MIAKQSASFLNKCLTPAHRSFSVAFNVKSKFETAFETKMKNLQAQPKKVQEPTNQAEYGQGYYQQHLKNMRQGYVHPYHSDKYPVVFSHFHYMKTLFEAVGPEQVSPHYESLSRSRRGLLFIFAYIGTINTISRFGGWSHNEWIRGMIFHHEFLIGFYLGYIEIRHFTYFIGPKFTVFYNVYSRYETQQLASTWADVCEEEQLRHLRHTKEQMEYVRINSEYDYVKKRALINFLTNEKLNLEQHFHGRVNNMLKMIQNYENQNLRNHLREIAIGSFEKVQQAIRDPATKDQIQRASFQSALQGIASGLMKYESDALLPLLQSEMQNRIAHFKGLSAAEESKLLSLTPEQRRIIADQDRKAKVDYLGTAPNINNPGIKSHDKYRNFVDMVNNIHRSELKA
jgi:hypothetical protein